VLGLGLLAEFGAALALALGGVMTVLPRGLRPRGRGFQIDRMLKA
jgi:hypothetical protein